MHDFVTVTGQPGSPPPSGNVTFQFFTNNTCTPPAAATSGNVALNGAGQADATGFPQGPLAPGFYGFQATYAGDATYIGSVGACEPLRVVDANIQLTPPTATNQVGTNHVLTCHVNVNDGSGLRERAGRDGLHGEHHFGAGHAGDAELHDDGRVGFLHGHDHVADDGHVDVAGDDDGVGRGCRR